MSDFISAQAECNQEWIFARSALDVAFGDNVDNGGRGGILYG
jgi:hypothetical protein